MATRTSQNLIRSATTAARDASHELEGAAAGDGGASQVVDSLRHAERKLARSLAEVRAASWLIVRRRDSIDERDLEILLLREAEEIRAAHGYMIGPCAVAS